jgi:two-component system, NtrC family, nitrogen regulation response regulator NtrX
MTRDAFLLVLEDHDKIRANLQLHLREAGFAVHAVASAEEAEQFLAEGHAVDVFIVDVRLTGESGIDFLKRRMDGSATLPAIIMSGEASMSETVEALRLGAYDLLQKPFTPEKLLQSVHNCLRHVALERELQMLRSRIDGRHTIVGQSAEMQKLRERIDRIAVTAARVLIRGESGTGKELVAHAIHRRSARSDAPFVKINCAAIPASLIEDELFGHARGAFTDARTAKPGLFEEAHRGTLFLDEVGDMEPSLQGRLLRVLEDGVVRRVGETQERRVDVRVIAATNRDLEEAVATGAFRDDLLFRLAAIPIEIPPLRERRVDIPLLFLHLLEAACTAHERRKPSVDPHVFDVLQQYRWPGNVRELRNVCDQLAVFATDPVTVEQLPSAIVNGTSVLRETGLVRVSDHVHVMPLREFKEQCEREYIEAVLRRTNWNVSEAARLLQIQRTYLHQKLVALKIEKPVLRP